MDRLDALRVFVTVAEEGGFAAAARKLGMSPPAVTRAIASLEERVGVELLRRTTRVVKLTDAGARFFAETRRILGELEDAEASASGSQTALRGTVAVTAPVMFGRLFVAPIVLEMLGSHPQVKVRALFVDRVVDLVEEGMDVAIRIANLPEKSTDVAAKVGVVRRVVCASPAFVAAHGAPETPVDLERMDAIAFSPAATEGDWAFPVEGQTAIVRPRVRLVVSSTELSVTAAVAGHGVARALSYQVAEEVRAGRLVVLLEGFEPPPVPVHVVYREGRRAAARVRAFVALAVERLRGNGALGAALRVKGTLAD